VSKAKRAKRSNRSNPREDRNHPNNVIRLQEKKQRKKIALIPRNVAQENYIEALEDDNTPIVVSTGPAGCGKTWLATLAAVKALNEGKCDKIVITRPNRAVDDLEIGHLPGDTMEKMAPWWRPLRDIFLKYYGPNELNSMLEQEIIEISPLAFMRGRTFDNSWIIGDEMQNSSPEQMKMLLTRIGENSKIVITGDPNQNDMRNKENGILDVINKLNFTDNNSPFALAEFSNNEIVRNPVISNVLECYGE